MRLRFFCMLLLLTCVPALAEIRVQDARGGELVLEKPAQRVISLAPHITEVVYAAGAGEQLVGVVHVVGWQDQCQWCCWPWPRTNQAKSFHAKQCGQCRGGGYCSLST